MSGSSDPLSVSGAATDADIFRTAREGLNRPLSHPRLREAAVLVENARLGQATRLLHAFVEKHPRDAGALRLMAHIALLQERKADAQELLQKCLELKPGFAAARLDHADLLLEANKPEAALAEADILLKQEPRNPLFRRLKADALEADGDYIAALELRRELTREYPASPECWVRYGKALRTLGSRNDCIAAYRRAVALDPTCSFGWLGLADLKTFRFSTNEINVMEAQLAKAELSTENRTNLHFALGKAYADAKLFEKSFSNFAKGNAIRRVAIQHDPNVLTAYVSKCKQVFRPELFRKNAGSGCVRPGAIFLVGMPRAGSTLVEQILASHTQIEGTKELVHLGALSREIQQLALQRGGDYPGVLAELHSADLRQLGERYFDDVKAHRKLGRTFFTDKMGANFVHVGLIQLILPHAKIVDVRRHPMACCLSNFSQLFTNGLNNAYRLGDLARLYRDYVELMAHFDAVLPGKVHRVFYERLVADPETEVRRLLAYIGVPFEDACLKFFDTDRAVATLSSEQVRRPIYRDALDHWRNYEPWLASLKTALGSVLDTYPEVPAFD